MNAVVNVDAPGDADGEWWLDLACHGFHTSLAWRPASGFGVFTSTPSFGSRPDEVYRLPQLAAQRTEQLYEQWQESKKIGPLWLNQMRKLAGTPQTELATALSCNQPAVSRFEQREDVKLSTLVSYVEAMGGRLEMRVHFDQWDAAIALPSGAGAAQLPRVRERR